MPLKAASTSLSNAVWSGRKRSLYCSCFDASDDILVHSTGGRLKYRAAILPHLRIKGKRTGSVPLADELFELFLGLAERLERFVEDVGGRANGGPVGLGGLGTRFRHLFAEVCQIGKGLP